MSRQFFWVYRDFAMETSAYTYLPSHSISDQFSQKMQLVHIGDTIQVSSLPGDSQTALGSDSIRHIFNWRGFRNKEESMQRMSTQGYDILLRILVVVLFCLSSFWRNADQNYE